MQTHEVKAMLKAKFAPPAYAILFEVGNGTGAIKSRSADAIAMSVWPSRGLELHGFEIKVSRSDWQKEIDSPAKAEAVCKYCDRWWLVAGDEKIVQPGELPPTWGLMTPSGKGLKTKIEAPKLEPVQASRSFVAELMRKSIEQNIDDQERQRIRREAFKDAEESAKIPVRHLLEELERLKKQAADFEKSSGVKLNQWDDGNRIGEAVAQVLRGNVMAGFRSQLQHAERLVSSLKEIVGGGE